MKRSKLQAISLCLVATALLLSGCTQSTSPFTDPVKSNRAAPRVHAFSSETPRADTAEAIDAEFAERFARKESAVDKAFRTDIVTDTAGDTRERMTYTHKFGTTELPTNPSRIVVIGLEDPMFALGVPMIAANIPAQFYLRDELLAAGIEPIAVNGDTRTVNLEQVQTVKPDLILLRDSFDKNTWLALSNIAPVAAFTLQDPETTLLAMAKALGQYERGKERLRKYYATAKEMRLRIKERIGNDSVAFLRILNKEIRLYPYSTSYISAFAYDLLNLTPDPMSVAFDEGNNSAVSLEMLPDIRADWLVVSSGYGMRSTQNDEIAKKRFASMKNDPLWSFIPAVKHGRMLEVDPKLWNSHGIISKERAMRELADWMAP